MVFTNKPKREFQSSPQVLFAGIYCICVGIAILFGWYTKNLGLIQIFPNYPPMQFNTAFSFILCGTSLLLCANLFLCAYGYIFWSQLLAILVTIIAGLTLVEYLLELNFGIDQLFIDSSFFAPLNVYPGRMAPNTALAFTLVGISFLLIYRSSKTSFLIGLCLNSLVIAIASVSCLGYLFGIEIGYGWKHLTNMSIHTSVSFLVLEFGLNTLFWKSFSTPEISFRRKLPLYIFIFLLSSTLLFWQILLEQEEKEIKKFVSFYTNTIQDEVLKNLKEITQELERLVRRMELNPSPELWKQDATFYLQNPAYQAIGYIGSSFQIKHFLSSEEEKRTFYQNLLLHENVRKVAQEAQTAKKWGMISSSQLKLSGSSIFMIFPLYSFEEPTGFLFVVLSIPIFMEYIISETEKSDFNIILFEHDLKLYESSSRNKAQPFISFEAPVKIDSIDWTLKLLAKENALSPNWILFPHFLALWGTLAGFIFAFILYFYQSTLLYNNQLKIANQKLSEEIQKRKHIEDVRDQFFTISLDMLCIAGFDGYFKELNSAWSKTLGYSLEELKASPYFNFIHPDDLQRTEIVEQNLTELEEPLFLFENRYRCKDGSYRWFLWSVTPVPEKQLLYAVARDITQLKKESEELKRAKEVAEEASRVKSDFLANMSHEIRTPLNAIMGYSECMLDEMDGPLTLKQIRSLKKVLKASQNLLEIINSILDLSKVESGKMELYLEPFNVIELIQNCVEIVESLIQEKELTLTTSYEVPYLEIKADSMKIRQSILNLLSNAIKFTSKQGKIRIQVKVERDRQFCIILEDSGIGMSPDEIAKIFSPFAQVDSSITRKYGGTGLGLIISKKFIELHGGTLEVQSEKGKGSIFILKLPLQSLLSSDPEQRIPAHSPTEEATMSKILLIDDDRTTTELIEKQLHLENFQVYSTNNSLETFPMIFKYKPDLLLLDLMMPQKDGFRILKELKANPETQNIPVVIISMFNNKELAMNLGAIEYLAKPIQKQKLVQCLHSVLRDH